MRQEERASEPLTAALSSSPTSSNLHASYTDPDQSPDDGATPTADERIAEALAAGLGGLRTARPGFQEQLERQLLARLAEPPRPWWRRFGSSRRQVRRSAPGIARLPRRSLLGLAAATALALTAASLSLPLVGTSEVSAREILEKAQASSENPVLAGVKSFHLTAKMWHAGDPKGLASGAQADTHPGPRELTTEQWFVAPDRMRTETRTQDANGKPVLSGFIMNGGDAKQYSTTGAADVFMISFFAAPVGAKPGLGPQTAAIGSGPPPGTPGTSATGAAGSVHVDRREVTDGKDSTVVFAVRKGEAKPGEEPHEVVFTSENCPEPRRTGEGTVAGRAVFVVENDFSTCMPANAPDEIRGKHVRWVDQKTYLPLKMESYDNKGALMDRYEVTSIEYDLSIPEKTFTEIPDGTSVREPMMVPALPGPPGQVQDGKPSTR
jgi:hypothetical protein